MNSRAGWAVVIGLVIATVLGWSSLLGSHLGISVLLMTVLCAGACGGLWWLLQRTSDARAALREKLAAGAEGQHHEFDGVTLRVEDDGRHVWLDGPGLLRVLRRREPEEALAARHTGAWRRTEQGVLMLRVDAVIAYLGSMPGRDEPRMQKLRRYLERDLLYPAQRRRERA